MAKVTEFARDAAETEIRVHRARTLLELYEKAGEAFCLGSVTGISVTGIKDNELDSSLIGLWNLDYLPADANKVPLERQTRTVINGRHLATFERDRLKEKFSYRVDKSVSPHRIWLTADGVEQLRGICKIEGDAMWLNMAFADAAFPKRFASERPEFQRSSAEIPPEFLKQLE